LDAYPAPIFVVDDDVRITRFNQAGKEMLGPRPRLALRKRGGEVLHCLHANETPEGCGHALACKTCVIRGSVNDSFAGHKQVRRKARLEVVTTAGVAELNFLVTAAPFTYHRARFCLLVIEDINDLIAMQKVIPVCAWCKKVRDDQEYWQNLESYLKRKFEVDVTHGICPACRDKILNDGLAATDVKPTADAPS
ncbi:MAG: PAS domain-containing protein, partial [bacterium]